MKQRNEASITLNKPNIVIAFNLDLIDDLAIDVNKANQNTGISVVVEDRDFEAVEEKS